MSRSSTAELAGASSLDASLGAAPRYGAVVPRRVSIRRAGWPQQPEPSGRRRGCGRAAASRLLPTPGSVAPQMDTDCHLTVCTTHPSDLPSSISMRIRRGVGAPNRARRSVLSQLARDIPQTTLSDVAMLVSELVTDSVLHDNVGAYPTLTVEVVLVDDRLRISVIDPGSRLEPRIVLPDPERVGGAGLFLVNELSEAWGVARTESEGTRVWCEILLNRPGPRSLGSWTASQRAWLPADGRPNAP